MSPRSERLAGDKEPMDLRKIIQIIRRRVWLVLSVVVVTVGAIGLRLLTTAPVYEAQVKLQLTAPPQEDVDLYERYRAMNARDEQTVVLNNFVEVLQSNVVADRTRARLGQEQA